MGFPDVTNRVRWGTWVTWLAVDLGGSHVGVGEKGTWCGAGTTTHSRTTVAHRWLWQCVLTLTQNSCGGGGGGGGVWREGSEEEEEASALRKPFGRQSCTLLEPLWCSSGTFLVPFISAFGDLCQRSPVGRTPNVRIESFKRVVLIVIFVVCGSSPCPLNPEESRTCG